MAVIFFHDDEQKKAAQQSMEEIAGTSGRKVQTKLEPYTNFYLAENYHQKYRLKMESGILSDLADYYPEKEDLTNSTAAARINGFLYGYGDSRYFEEISGDLGLSENSLRTISRTLSGR